MVGGQIKGRNAKNLAETPASSAERRRCAISTIAVSLFCNDQARGNFAYQSDQELALALCGGNSVRTVQMQTYVTSASAIAQFASNQLVGRLCDSCGRRPLLIGMPLLMALLRLCVVARPCWPTLFTAELASYMMFQVQMTPIEAALGDLYPEADALAKASSRVYSIKGLSSIVGPPIGVWLVSFSHGCAQGVASFAGLLSAILCLVHMPETMPPPPLLLPASLPTSPQPTAADGEAPGSKDAALDDNVPAPPSGGGSEPRGGSANPFNFARLFNKSAALSALTCVSALQNVAEFTFDVDHHLYRAVGMDGRLIGLFFTCQGISAAVSGQIASWLISSLGPLGYTALANAAAITSMLLKGFARTPAWVFLSLLPYTFGPMFTRSAAVHALHTTEAQSHGLAMGELIGARANFFTLLKMVVPLGYARLYARERQLPYIMAAALVAIAQVLMLVVQRQLRSLTKQLGGKQS